MRADLESFVTQSSHAKEVLLVEGFFPHLHFGTLLLPTYFVVISLACCLGVYWGFRRAADRKLSQDLALNLSLILLVSGFLSARLAHILIEAPLYYWQNPWQVFSLGSGGFVFYGGALGAYLTGRLYLQHRKQNLAAWHDLAAPVVGLSYALGRLGCFAAGCCYGGFCPWPWGLEAKQLNLVTGQIATLSRHPTQVYAFLTELILVLFLLWWERSRTARPWWIFSLWLIGHGLGRLLMEYFRADPRGPELLISVSSWLSLILILVGARLAYLVRLKG